MKIECKINGSRGFYKPQRYTGPLTSDLVSIPNTVFGIHFKHLFFKVLYTVFRIPNSFTLNHIFKVISLFFQINHAFGYTQIFYFVL